ncbi:MAG: FAD-binding dehydrogenase [Betaproteobacteria bacterium]|nr:FAD-binding dehydrogenase [Betaproteobacteria bacterium]
MADSTSDVIVAGCGIGGMAAAVAALQSGAKVTVLERAPHDERGGQTRYTEAYLRMKSEHEVTDDFEAHLAENASGYLDPSLVHATAGPRESWPGIVKSLSFSDPELISTFADSAGPTIQWLKQFGLKFDFLPTQFLTKSQPRLLPVGGGLALIEALGAAAEKAGAKFEYETAATGLIQNSTGQVIGVRATGKGGLMREFSGKAVVLACGGFEGNAEMLTRYMGPRSNFLRPVCRGGYYNKGEGIQMALDIGAAPCGDFGSYHAEPVDPRSGIAEPSVFIFPYGILVNSDGVRFTDEAPGTVDAWYERVTRQIFNQANGIAYVILDARHLEIPNYKLGLRTDQPPIVSNGIRELANRIGVPADALNETVSRYNRACSGGNYTPLVLDGLSTRGISPAKSNWAHRIDRAPFHAYPIISSNVFTFGGLKVDSRARVLNNEGDPIPGLYAAGEIIGSYYRNYTGATSVLKGAVFGRLAGADAATLY